VRKHLSAFVVAILAAIALSVPAASSVAAVTCQGSGCNGLSPVTTGCQNDAYTATSAYITNSAGTHKGLVELRWSNACLAVWSRVTSYMGATTIKETARAGYPANGYLASDVDYNTAGPAWSPMAGPWLDGAIACGTLANTYNRCVQFNAP
jgi:hypothetical protein